MRQLTRGNFAPTSKQALELFGTRHRIERLLRKTDHVPQIPLGDGLLRTQGRESRTLISIPTTQVPKGLSEKAGLGSVFAI